jgi:lipopolysaccharide/colanic/teichoic acid biosynthesis glycosyltransferase
VWQIMRDAAAILEPSTTIAPVRAVESRTTAVACRALDVVIALVALLVLALPLIVIALVIRLDSQGRALFRQERLGRDLRPFVVNKFRTMHANTSHEEHRAFVQRLIAGHAECHRGAGDEALFKLASDTRVTRVGRFLRRSSLDELPQLLNVLRGDMSLVGPRPPLGYEVERYPERAFGRFAVKPGITGWWQVNGRSRVSFDEMISLDLEYVERQGFWFNVTILVRTLPVVLTRQGAA